MRGAATTTGWAPFLGAGTKQVAPNPLRPLGCRGTAPPAVLSLLDDALRHRRRRDALHPGPWRRQRDLREFFSSLLGHWATYDALPSRDFPEAHDEHGAHAILGLTSQADGGARFERQPA